MQNDTNTLAYFVNLTTKGEWSNVLKILSTQFMDAPIPKISFGTLIMESNWRTIVSNHGPPRDSELDGLADATMAKLMRSSQFPIYLQVSNLFKKEDLVLLYSW